MLKLKRTMAGGEESLKTHLADFPLTVIPGDSGR